MGKGSERVSSGVMRSETDIVLMFSSSFWVECQSAFFLAPVLPLPPSLSFLSLLPCTLPCRSPTPQTPFHTRRARKRNPSYSSNTESQTATRASFSFPLFVLCHPTIVDILFTDSIIGKTSFHAYVELCYMPSITFPVSGILSSPEQEKVLAQRKQAPYFASNDGDSHYNERKTVRKRTTKNTSFVESAKISIKEKLCTHQNVTNHGFQRR